MALVHGFGSSRHLWRRVLPEAPGALAPDLLGFGDAASLGRPQQTTQDMAEQLASVLRAAGGGPYHLVGHSMGGKVALVLAARAPELVARLVLVAPSPPTPEPMTQASRAELRASYADADALEAQLRRITLKPLAAEDVRQWITDGQRASRDAWQAWTDVGSRQDLTRQLGQLNVPITVLFSEDDPAISAQTIRAEVIARLPGARAESIRGSGHLIPLEAPHSVVSALQR